MLLRRVAKHIKEQNWFAVALDFAIVVAGVFVGLQVNNWNEAARDQRAEIQYLSQLRGDLQRIEAETAAQLDFEHFQARLAGTVFDLIEHDNTQERSARINVGLSQLTMRRTLRAESPTFVDLQSSGDLEIISDTALRNDIIAYFAATRRLEAALDKNNGYFVDEGFGAAMRAVGVQARPWNDALMSMSLPKSVPERTAFQSDVLTTPLFGAPAQTLLSPPDADFWGPIIVQLSWRAQGAVHNIGLADRMRSETREIELEIAEFLDGTGR
jgi:hypothetical protein